MFVTNMLNLVTNKLYFSQPLFVNTYEGIHKLLNNLAKTAKKCGKKCGVPPQRAPHMFT